MGYAEKAPEESTGINGFKPEEFEAVWAGQVDPVAVSHGDPVGDMSVEEAAKLLGITTKAIIKRLQRGSLPGKKVEIKGVQQWRVLQGEWTRDAQVQQTDSSAIPAGSPLSSEDVRTLLDGIEEIRYELSRPQVAIDRGGEVEELQRQLIAAQQLVIRMQEDKQLLSLRVQELEIELKQLPDLELKNRVRDAELAKLKEEKASLETSLQEMKQSTAGEQQKKWWQRLW